MTKGSLFERDHLAALRLFADTAKDEVGLQLETVVARHLLLNEYKFSAKFKAVLLERATEWERLPYVITETIHTIYPEVGYGSRLVRLFESLSEKKFSRNLIGQFIQLTFAPLPSKYILILYFSKDLSRREIDQLVSILNDMLHDVMQSITEVPRNTVFRQKNPLVKADDITHPGSVLIGFVLIAGAAVTVAGVAAFTAGVVHAVAGNRVRQKARAAIAQVRSREESEDSVPEVALTDEIPAGPRTESTRKLENFIDTANEGTGNGTIERDLVHAAVQETY